jgi:hypothetical protein
MLRTPFGSPTLLASPFSYGIAIDHEGNVWSTQNHGPLEYPPCVGAYLIKFNPDGTRADGFEQLHGKCYAGGNYDKGAAVTLMDDDLWIANSGGATVTRLNSEGADPATIDLAPNGVFPHALAVDHRQHVWVTCKGTDESPHHDTAILIDPGEDHYGAEIEAVVDLGLNARPYNYSDMTGQVTLHTTGMGTWNVTHDSERFGSPWHVITWNREQCATPQVPPGTALTVEVRAADVQTELTMIPYQALEPNTGYWREGIEGRYLQIRVHFIGSCPGVEFATPVLCDLSASMGVGDCNCDGVVNNFDTTAFVKALTATPPDYHEYYDYYPHCSRMSADVNCDGALNNFDITPFVHCVAYGECGCSNAP